MRKWETELDFAAALNVAGTDWNEQLATAAKSNDYEKAWEALVNGANVDASYPYHPMALAVRNNNIEIVDLLLAAGSRMHERSFPSRENYPEIQRSFVAYGLEPNLDPDEVKTYRTGKTPLIHVAARAGNAECLALLLAAGAKLDLEDDRGRTVSDVVYKVPGRTYRAIRKLLKNAEQGRCPTLEALGVPERKAKIEMLKEKLETEKVKVLGETEEVQAEAVLERGPEATSLAAQLKECAKGGIPTTEMWEAISNGTPMIKASLLNDDHHSEAEVNTFFRNAAAHAHKAGLDCRQFIAKAFPLEEAASWLSERGKSLKASDLLNEDGTVPQGQFICQGGIGALFRDPTLWESTVQARKALDSLPKEQREAIPNRHQFMAALSQKEQQVSRGRG